MPAIMNRLAHSLGICAFIEILYALQLRSSTRVLSTGPSHHNHVIGEAIGIRLGMDHLIAFAQTQRT